jgi:hypothetical protein
VDLEESKMSKTAFVKLNGLTAREVYTGVTDPERSENPVVRAIVDNDACVSLVPVNPRSRTETELYADVIRIDEISPQRAGRLLRGVPSVAKVSGSLLALTAG